jgi:hypothetical protein
MRSVLEDKLREIPGSIENLEHDAVHPDTAVTFADWKEPAKGSSSPVTDVR